ncbi:MAG: peptide deformylase [Coriobacteriales bacterium]|jgi:peptide deformylase|nr:peptide deformylase [Coriobacteriales bacterium]
MKIVLSPDPVLREKCEPVEPAELKKMRPLAKQMAKLMYKSDGVGIAAPQVGVTKRLVVIDAGDIDESNGKSRQQNPTYFINPVIKRTWGDKVTQDEGCLSIPGISIPIKRPTHVEVEAVDLDGVPFSLEAEFFEARAILHELDHLDGITMFEHLDPIARIDAFKRYEDALEAGAKPGETGK